MKLTATREEILAPVQNVIGVVERRQTMPVLSNVLLTARDGKLSVTGTDLEVELVSSISLKVAAQGEITVPGRKFLDILRALPEGVNVTLSIESDRLVVRAGRSRFTLSTLAAIEQLGALVERRTDGVMIRGVGLRNAAVPKVRQNLLEHLSFVAAVSQRRAAGKATVLALPPPADSTLTLLIDHNDDEAVSSNRKFGDFVVRCQHAPMLGQETALMHAR
jgi:hypothetical protein